MKSIKSSCIGATKSTSFTLKMSGKQRKIDFTETYERDEGKMTNFSECKLSGFDRLCIITFSGNGKYICVWETEFIAIDFYVRAHPLAYEAQANEYRTSI